MKLDSILSYVASHCDARVLNLIRRRVLTVQLRFLLGTLAAMCSTTALAQSETVYIEPVFLWNFYNVQDCGGCSVPSEFLPSLSQPWDFAQSIVNGTRDGTTYTAYGLMETPGSITFNGIPYQNEFSVQACQTGGGCNDLPNTGYIQTLYACPPNTTAGDYDYSPPNQLIACALTVPGVQAPPKFCLSCLSDPIYAGTGQELQVETDYAGVSGLKFIRTYLSNNGYFASVLTQAFVDNSAPGGTLSQQCYPASWTYSNTSGSYCFPFISTYPFVNGGVAQYQLRSDDGRWFAFSGPNTAITANADINERVTMLTVSGATEWQVNRDDDSVEIYNAGGALIQKTLRGGQSFTYTYSTSGTPVNIAPKPGLLLTQSDAFGHTLSWQYNAAAQMTQMTDPAGGIFQYNYDGNGNLTGVVYPDLTTKTYWYNESVNTGGANLPSALTGITDESVVRYSTFQYKSANNYTFAVNAQHAGGVDNYSFTYDPAAYYGSPVTSTVVTDPLLTQRTYQFTNQSGLSYNDDESQTQPAASGSGTVTKSQAYDANGNPASVTDYNGNLTCRAYDLARNLELVRVEGFAPGSTCPTNLSTYTPQSGTLQRKITTQWNTTWRQPQLISEPNRTTAFTYDSLGNMHTKTITDLTVTPNVTRTWTNTYDTYGRLMTAQGPRTDVVSTVTYQYYNCTTGYQCGEIQTRTNEVGQITTFNTYNAHGQPLTITDPNGVVTTLS